MEGIEHVHETVDRGARGIDGLVSGQPFGGAPRDTHHAQGHDEGHHAEDGDDEAVDQPDHPGHRDGQGSGKKWRGSSMSMRLLIGERGALTVWFPASHLAVPRAIPIMPRVTMKGIMRKTAMMRPLINPINPATAMVRAMAAPGPKPRTSEVAPTTPARATTEPTLKSMPPLTMIMVMPSAPMATITVCSRMILQLVPVKKVSRTVGLRENRPITSASPNTGPMALTSRQALRRSILEERVMRGSDIWVQGGFGLPDGGRPQGGL